MVIPLNSFKKAFGKFFKDLKTNRNKRLSLILIVGLIAISTLLVMRFTAPEIEKVDYTEAIEIITSDKVEEVTIDQSSYTLSFKDVDGKEYSSVYIKGYEEKLIDTLENSDVKTKINPIETPSFISNLILAIAPVIIIVVFLLFIMGGLGNLKKEQTVLERPKTRLKDVAGVDEAVEDMKEIVDYLQNPEPYKRLTAKPPSGVLLVGPPGTGKTLLARAIAGEANVPFFQTTGADFVEMFAGVGPKRVRELFKKAKKSGKAVIFIDEIDAIGRQRNQGRADAVTREMDSTLTTLLTEIDGFEKNDIIVIGATNLPESLDPALSRRLHKVVNVPLPDSKGRAEILKIHSKNRPFSQDINWDRVSKQTIGFSGAQLSLIVDEACLIATKRNAEIVEERDLIESAVTLHVGKERKSAVMTDYDKSVTAYHEAGHAIVAQAIESAMKPSYVTIIPRGQSGGHTRFDNSENNYFTKNEFQAQLAASMGGRAAEIIKYGKDGFTQGAGGDIKAATSLAIEAITYYGMGSQLYYLDKKALELGTNVSEKVYSEVETLISDALQKAITILRENNKVLELLKDSLLSSETLDGEELQEILKKVKVFKK